MIAVIGIFAFVIVAAVLAIGMPKPPPVESEQQLLEDGFSKKQARAELRAQRQEHRSHRRANGTHLRTATKVGNFAMRVAKKLK